MGGGAQVCLFKLGIRFVARPYHLYWLNSEAGDIQRRGGLLSVPDAGVDDKNQRKAGPPHKLGLPWRFDGLVAECHRGAPFAYAASGLFYDFAFRVHVNAYELSN